MRKYSRAHGSTFFRSCNRDTLWAWWYHSSWISWCLNGWIDEFSRYLHPQTGWGYYSNRYKEELPRKNLIRSRYTLYAPQSPGDKRLDSWKTKRMPWRTQKTRKDTRYTEDTSYNQETISSLPHRRESIKDSLFCHQFWLFSSLYILVRVEL